MSKETGGPAFPAPINPGHKRQDDSHMNGMTLRDYFAAKALDGFMNWALGQPHFKDYDTAAKAAAGYAKSAYLIAEAMLAERAK